MASFTLNGGDRFPEGTSVSVYAHPILPPIGGRPSGSAVATGTIAGGQAVFSTLADSTQYVAYAQVGGQDRYSNFKTDPTPTGVTVVTGGGGTNTGYLGDYTSLVVGSAVSANQLASYNGSLYARIADGTISGTFNPAHWTLIGITASGGSGSGYLGGFTFLTNGAAVSANQLVSYSGDLYARKTTGTINLASTPNVDTTNWTKLTSNGLGYAINPTGAIAESFPRYCATNPSLLGLTSGTLQVTALEVQCPANTMVTQVTVHSGDRLAVGQTHLCFAIYDAATRAVLGRTVDDLTSGWVNDTAKTLALAAPWTPTVDTSIRVGVLQVATTTSRLVVPGASGVPTGLLTVAPPLGQLADSGLNGTPAGLPATYTASAVALPFYAYVS